MERFLGIYKQLSSETPDRESMKTKPKKWMKDFLELTEGHQKASVTPYMHVLAYHVHDQIRRFGNIRKYSGQGEFSVIMLTLLNAN